MYRPYRFIVAFTVMATLSAYARAGETISYAEGATVLKGYLATPEGIEAGTKVPGVIIVHEWWGLGEHVRDVADQLADEGYVAFALDMYGDGKTTTEASEAMEWSGEIKSDPELAKRRFLAARDELLGPISDDLPYAVDPGRLASIGFCFGGTISLEMARSGLDLAGVVSFHGGLKSSIPKDDRDIQTKILVCHGADDPHVGAEEVAAFKQEMRDAEADWQFISYGNAVHSFTNPAADFPGARYEERAAKRSFRAMLDFFREVL